MAVNTASVSTAIGQETFTTGSVTARDGVAIGYRQIGRGPGLAVLHGAMESAHSHIQLAEALAGDFTVTLADRRGRGLSGPFAADYSLQNEVDDMEALLAKTGARYVFGVSSGAIIWLRAALALPAIQKIAIYEPPLFMDKSTPSAILTRYDAEVAQGRLAAAMVTGMLGAQMGPPIFNSMPRWLLEILTRMGMAQDDKVSAEGYVSMRALGPLLHYDFSLVAEMSGRLESFRAVQQEALLLGGSQSPAYLKAALGALEGILPNARRVEFAGLHHGGSGNADRGGQPETVARELRRFFA